MSRLKHWASLTLSILICLGAMSGFVVAQEEQAIAAFNRGKNAFDRGNYSLARDQFSSSYSHQRRPVTAYFLSYAYMNLRNYRDAEHWAALSLRPMTPYTLDAPYRDGASKIIQYSRDQLAPKPAPQAEGNGIGVTTSAITIGPPRPPVPAPLPTPAPLLHERLRTIDSAAAIGKLAAGVQPTIQVLTATYGANCGVARGNVTRHISDGCNGKDLCKYVVDFNIIGDPARGCVKDYDVIYGCGGSKTQKAAHIGGEEAGFKKVVVLSCP